MNKIKLVQPFIITKKQETMLNRLWKDFPQVATLSELLRILLNSEIKRICKIREAKDLIKYHIKKEPEDIQNILKSKNLYDDEIKQMLEKMKHENNQAS